MTTDLIRIEARSLVGMPRNRAGHRVDTKWTALEVTPEQLAAIEADRGLEVRRLGREAEAAVALEVAGELSAEVAQLRRLVADRDARIADLEGELSRAQASLQEALRDLEALTAPAPVSPTVDAGPVARVGELVAVDVPKA